MTATILSNDALSHGDARWSKQKDSVPGEAPTACQTLAASRSGEPMRKWKEQHNFQ